MTCISQESVGYAEITKKPQRLTKLNNAGIFFIPPGQGL